LGHFVFECPLCNFWPYRRLISSRGGFGVINHERSMQKCLFFLAVCLFSISLTKAAPPPTTATSLATTNPSAVMTPPPIGLGDVASQSESLAISLRQMKSDRSSDETVQAIGEELPVLSQEIDARLDESSRLLASNPSLEILPEMEADWQAIDSNLVGWKRSLTKRSDQFKSQIAHLTDIKADWAQTLQYANNRGASADIRQNIERTIEAITGAQDEIQVALSHIWKLNRNVDEQNARVLDVLASVKQAQQEAFDRLLVRDSPPIWSLVTHWPADRNLVEETADSFSIQLQGLSAYALRERIAFVVHGVIFLFLAVILLWIRARVAGATPVFQSPLLASIVLSFLVSPWIYPLAPRLFWEIVGAAALIPTVLILRQLIQRRLFPILNAMVILYFCDQLRAVVASQLVLPRLLFLVELLAGILFLAVYLTATRSRAPAGKPADGLWKTMQIAAGAALIVFSIAFLAGVLGYVSLANLIGNAALGSAYLAVILYATTRIAEGLLTIALRMQPLVLLMIVRENEKRIRRRVVQLLVWVAFAVWTISTLEMLSLRSAAFAGIQDLLSAPISIGSIQLSLGRLLAFVITIWAAFFVSRLLRFILEEDVYERLPVSTDIAYAVSKILHYAILVIGFVIAIAALGYNMTSFTILIGAFGVGVGFGLQNVINNFVSGLILLFERPVKVGDVIELDDVTGVVARIGIRATVLATIDSSEIIVPNGSILSSRVTNWTHSNRQRGIEIPVGVAGGCDPKRVIEVLKSVAAAHPLITDAPPPEAFFEKFAGDGFVFRLRAWTNRAESWVEISSDLAVAINSAFVKENIVLK
jgi:potassium efflux system protein